MQTAVKTESSKDYQTMVKEWFDNVIEDINIDRMMMETGTAPQEKRKSYEDRMFGRLDNTYADLRKESSMYFLEKLLTEYLVSLGQSGSLPVELALNLSDAKILVWAKISDDDEAVEDALLLSEAKANSKFSNNGFYILTTIVEESDKLNIPPHYHSVTLK